MSRRNAPRDAKGKLLPENTRITPLWQDCELPLRLGWALQRFEQIYLSKKPPLGLHQYLVLLHFKKPQKPGDVSRALRTDMAFGRNVLHKALQTGRIKRVGDGTTILTQKGWFQVEDCEKLVREAQAEFWEKLTDPDRGIFMAFLRVTT